MALLYFIEVFAGDPEEAPVATLEAFAEDDFDLDAENAECDDPACVCHLPESWVPSLEELPDEDDVPLEVAVITDLLDEVQELRAELESTAAARDNALMEASEANEVLDDAYAQIGLLSHALDLSNDIIFSRLSPPF